MPPPTTTTTTATKKRRTRSDYLFHQTHQTRWHDNDMYAHLNNTVYTKLFDSIINTYLITHCGMNPFSANNPTEKDRTLNLQPGSQSTPQPGSQTTGSQTNESQTTSQTSPATSPTTPQIGLIIASHCDYFASVSFPDTLELGLRVNQLGRSSVTYEVGVFRRGEAAVKVVGGYTHVFVARETMRPTAGEMDPAVRRGLERLLVAGSSSSSSQEDGGQGPRLAGEKARL
ncbi:hypothetical protein BO86DRAFT_405666 [Aspergillus japonicus CBS 114.51]|uniref:Thioesterase domain-containing protein n=1 Tax=Aspergillus japonicus CBS 114.51 TaxID=1448312 RepID=A0A8T8XH58_ASPJA|nr:hypothetical protein BO86DRAFT_405666 [Aspergillus japonicus CBS 114.51]RAH87703.1 hypothetical protein BO86DRAFT_405666 [Aspergillus japonicus CBS 114.51]